MSRAAAAKQLTALEHLRELWFRLVGPLLVLFAGGIAAYIFREPIIRILQRPLGEKLYYTSPMGSFQFIMQVCFLCGIVLALPILLYNIIRFIEPAFSKRLSRRLLFVILVSSLALAAVGIAFAYFITLPVALKFFDTVGTKLLHPLISANQYFSFVLGYLATFAIVFQIPLLLLFINHITPFKPGGLTKYRKYVYVGAFAISLLMPSSPDPLSQVSLAIPIICLYETSVFLIWNVNRKHRRKTANELTDNFEMPSSNVKSDENLQFLQINPREEFTITQEQGLMRSRSQAVVTKRPVEPVQARAIQQRTFKRSNYENPGRAQISAEAVQSD